MDNLKILIVEDERWAALDIQEQLLEFGYDETFIAGDSNTAMQIFRSHLIDLVLMDIKLDGSSIDGIAIAEIFNRIRKVPIIYLTSHHDTHIVQRAGTTNPSNYLLKNTPKEQLKIAINLAKSTFLAENTSQNTVQNGKAVPQKILPNKMTFHKMNGILEIVPVEDIVYCEADGAVTKVFLKDYKKDAKKKDVPSFTAMKNLGYYDSKAQMMPDVSFFRIRSNLLVNASHIKNYNPTDRLVTLTNGQSLIAGREGGRALKDAL